jgi:hypothetical protein
MPRETCLCPNHHARELISGWYRDGGQKTARYLLLGLIYNLTNAPKDSISLHWWRAHTPLSPRLFPWQGIHSSIQLGAPTYTEAGEVILGALSLVHDTDRVGRRSMVFNCLTKLPLLRPPPNCPPLFAPRGWGRTWFLQAGDGRPSTCSRSEPSTIVDDRSWCAPSDLVSYTRAVHH